MLFSEQPEILWQNGTLLNLAENKINSPNKKNSNVF